MIADLLGLFVLDILASSNGNILHGRPWLLLLISSIHPIDKNILQSLLTMIIAQPLSSMYASTLPASSLNTTLKAKAGWFKHTTLLYWFIVLLNYHCAGWSYQVKTISSNLNLQLRGCSTELGIWIFSHSMTACRISSSHCFGRKDPTDEACRHAASAKSRTMIWTMAIGSHHREVAAKKQSQATHSDTPHYFDLQRSSISPVTVDRRLLLSSPKFVIAIIHRRHAAHPHHNSGCDTGRSKVHGYAGFCLPSSVRWNATESRHQWWWQSQRYMEDGS